MPVTRKGDLKKLVRKIRKGDQEAFEQLFLEYYEPLCKFAWRYTSSIHVSEELVQDIFLIVWESRKTLDPKKNIKSFLFQSVRNKALNYINHEELARNYNKEIEWLNPSPARQTHKLDDNSEFVRAVRKAIEGLPEGAQNVYRLSRKEGLTYQEIAEVLDISQKTVESQMSRALKLLRKALSQYLDDDNLLSEAV